MRSDILGNVVSRVICPMGLCRVWCLAVGVAFRRDARPRPTGLCHVCCVAVGDAFRRDARPRPTVCATIMLLCYALQVRTAEDVCPYGLCHVDALRCGLPFGGTRGTRPTDCSSFVALRWGLPFGGTRGLALRLCRNNAVVLRPTGYAIFHLYLTIAVLPPGKWGLFLFVLHI